jgi:hypothetical protein
MKRRRKRRLPRIAAGGLPNGSHLIDWMVG